MDPFLELVSQCQSGQTISVSKRQIVDRSSWKGSLQRWMSGESRYELLTEIELRIPKVLKEIKEEYRYEEIKSNMLFLQRVKRGLEAIRETYYNDSIFKHGINTMIQGIEIVIDEKGYKPIAFGGNIVHRVRKEKVGISNCI